MAELAERVTPMPSMANRRRAGRRRWAFFDVRAWPIARQVLLALLVLYFGKQLINVVVFPPFSGHDEVAHYSYLETVATEYRIPVLLEDRLPDVMYRYCEYILDWQCFPGFDETNPPHAVTYGGGTSYPAGMQYAANHPPLYYIIMTPLFWMSDDFSQEAQQYLIRAATIPFGVLAVIFAYLLARTLFPGDVFLAITIPAFVAFQPQISYEAAMVNNDIVCIALYGALLWLSVLGMRDRFPYRLVAVIGVVLGLALLSKGTSLTALAPIGMAIFFGMGWRNVRAWVTRGLLVTGIAGLVSLPWYVFLYRTYGNLSGLPQIEELQIAWNRPEGGFFDLFWNRGFAVMRWRETWGEFGWRRIRLGDGLLWVIGVVLLVALAGLVYYAVMARVRTEKDRPTNGDPIFAIESWQALALVVLFLTCVIAYLAVVQFGTTFQLTQARYYFPAISAAGLLLMLGVRALLPRSALHYGQAVCIALLLAMNLAIYTQYVIPYWHSSS